MLECCKKREPKAVLDIACNVVSHNETAAGKTSNEIGEEADPVEIFRPPEQVCNTVTRSDIVRNDAEEDHPENEQQLIFFEIQKNEAKMKGIKEPPEARMFSQVFFYA
jgi:hypothetical protein